MWSCLIWSLWGFQPYVSHTGTAVPDVPQTPSSRRAFAQAVPTTRKAPSFLFCLTAPDPSALSANGSPGRPFLPNQGLVLFHMLSHLFP